MAGESGRWRRRYAIAVAAVIGGALAYGLCDWGQWPRLTLEPYGGSWSWPGGPTRTVPINYFGGLLWGAGGAVVGGAIGAVLGPRLAQTKATRGLTTAWALTAVALVALYFLWTLWPF